MLRVGVIGVGKMGRHHARIYSTLAGASLVGVFDTDVDAAREVAATYGTRYFERFESLLDVVDAVSIATPTTTHAEYARAAIDRGIHVLIEKPIADSVRAAHNIVQLASQRDVVVAVGHVERYNPVVRKLRELLEKEEPELILLRRVGPYPPRITDVGIIMDLGIHDIDIARYLSRSEPRSIKCLKKRACGVHEDVALVSMEMESGCVVSLTLDWLTPYKVREVDAATATGLFSGNLITQTLKRFSHYEEDNSYLVHEIPVKSAEPLRAELEEFVNKIISGKGEIITAQEGLINIEIAENCMSQ